MIAEAPYSYWMIVLLIVLYLIICIRVALRMAATGRSFWKWVLITCFATAIPAMLVLMRQRTSKPSSSPEDEPTGREQARPTRCPHCGKVIVEPGEEIGPGLNECPHCGLPVDKGKTG